MVHGVAKLDTTWPLSTHTWLRGPRMSYLSLPLSVSPSCNSGVGRATVFSGVHDILLG